MPKAVSDSSSSDEQPMLELAVRVHPPAAARTVVRNVTQPQNRNQSFSLWTKVQAAWSIWNAGKTGASDIAFEAALSPHHTTTAKRRLGARITPAPLRAIVDRNGLLSELFQQLQSQSSNSTELQNELDSRRKCRDWDAISELNALVVVQPPEDQKNGSTKQNSQKVQTNVDGDCIQPYSMMLVAQLVSAGLELSLSFDPARMETQQAKKSLAQLEHILQQVCAKDADKTPIAALESACKQDLADIWRWNASVAPAVKKLFHHLVEEVAQQHPDSPAVCAWDGELTYAELDKQSTRLAYHLAGLGVGPEVIVPLCFEKSKWTPVSMLAVIKAGGACVMLDPTLPDERLRIIASQVKATVILASTANENRAGQLVHSATIAVPERLVQTPPPAAITDLPSVDISNKLYVVFTSGSTGTPKGAIISHYNFCSAVVNQQNDNGIDSSSRVYDFASHAYDVTWSNNLRTMAVGGCICIPSQQDRQNNLVGSIRRLRANCADLTTSVARLINPEDIPEFKSLIFSGEPVMAQDVAQWRNCPELRNVYGPAECSVHVSMTKIDPDVPGAPSIGRGSGVATWIVDRETGTSLVPVGDIGELLVEGATVGQGYLSDPAKTKAAFIQDPPWLLMGGPYHPGRYGRVYKTGDLVRYNPDGSLMYMGRKDAQVKIHGQRVELGDIEYHVQQILAADADCQVVADVVTPEGTNNPMLVAFVSIAGEPLEHHDKNASRGMEDSYLAVKKLTAGVKDKLSELLPSYMVPTIYIPVDKIPMTPTGKTDRRKLREAGPAMAQKLLAENDASRGKKRKPSTKMERQLQTLWAVLLGVDSKSIGADDSFLQIGGDSLKAMQLVGAARQQNLDMTVATIFQHPRLCDLAQLITPLPNSGDQAVVPFSLLRNDVKKEDVRDQVASLLCVNEDRIEDVFPCTALQEGLLALTAKHSGKYMGHIVLELKDSADLERFKAAWEQVVATTPILRTYIVSLPKQGLVQAVVAQQIHWFSRDKQASSRQEAAKNMGLSTPLVRFTIVDDRSTGKRFLEWTLHHAVYDGWSLSLILDQVEKEYQKENRIPLPSFQPIVSHIMDQNPAEVARYWQSQLGGCEAPLFPALPTKSYQPHADQTYGHQISGLDWPKSDITASSTIRTALAILISQYTSADDVCFGAVVTGRQAAVANIERTAGPTIATVPVRVIVDKNAHVKQLLSQVQRQTTAMTNFEQTGLQRIRRISSDLDQASQFQTLVVIQPPQQSKKESTIFEHDMQKTLDEGGDESAYALEIICYLEDNGLQININFDSSVLDNEWTKRIGQQLEHILRQVCIPQNESKRLSTIEWIGHQDLEDIWAWNASPWAPVQMCVHHIIDGVVRRQPQAPAICAWDGDVTYAELDSQATRLAHHLVSLGVGPDVTVPLCFEKSKWATISMLAVMKAGGVSIAMETSLPEDRLRTIVSQVKGPVILCSAACEARANRLINDTTIVVPEKVMQKLPTKSAGLPDVSPSDKLYIIFTSGSTGTPKGAVMTHSNFSSAIQYQQKELGFDKSSRVYDFASYAFDTAWSNNLQSLAAGGCVCIPSQEDRQNQLAESVRKLKANYLHLTPSVARLIDFSKLPELQRLVVGGELLLAEDVAKWRSPMNLATIPKLTNTYGPAECTVTATIYGVNSSQPENPSIGWGSGQNTWVIDTKGEGLVPIGAVGELWLEGPLVGQGYLADVEKTAAAFVENPSWLLRGGPNHLGRHGRMYKTGDLVRYNSNGSLAFIGRKDSQVKIHGQRVDLGDIEHYMRDGVPEGKGCQLVAEMITPKNSNNAVLAAFITTGEDAGGTKKDDWDAQLKALVEGVEARLGEQLPPYMIPSVYHPIGQIPMTATGKTDRRRLRNIGASFTLEELRGTTATEIVVREPSTDTERQLQAIWAAILDININIIGADQSFFKLGGDSIAAMRLVGAAREEGLSFTVSDMFRHPRLFQLAKVVKYSSSNNAENIEAFSLLKEGVDSETARKQVAELCQTSAARVEDIFPCTALQEGLLALTVKRPGDYVCRCSFELQENIDMNLFCAAWEDVAAKTPILRTRIVDLPGQGLVQVVLSDSIHWLYKNDNKSIEVETMGLGTPLVRYGLEGCAGGKRCFEWTIHHALYDGWSLPLILRQVEKAYRRQPRTSLAPFQSFVKSTLALDHGSTATYWRSQLGGCEAIPFPSLPRPDYQPQADTGITHEVSQLTWPKTDITAATVVRAAWSILTARYTNTNDVVFGATVTGRQAAVAHIERIAGPTIATVPVRILLNKAQESTAEELLQQVQQQATGMIEFEQTGIQRIRRLGQDLEQASQFQTLLVIQPEDQVKDNHSAVFKSQDESSDETDNWIAFNSYALTLVCQLGANGLNLTLNFDSSAVKWDQIQRMAQQMEHIIRQLCMPENGPKPVTAMAISGQDLQDIWQLNASAPPSIQKCVHHLIEGFAQNQPDAPAICAWDGEFTYAELNEKSTQLAHYLIKLGVKPEVIVPLCFEKSKWTPVAMLGIMKAGGASVTMDTSVPDERLNLIINQVKAPLILSSAASETRAGRLAGNPMVVVPEKVTEQRRAEMELPTITPSNTLYIVFTSGTTGVPKGAIITHANFASAVEHQKGELNFTPASRVYDFVSYAFDVAWTNNLRTLATGGCICIPSDSDRQNAITSSINRLRANLAILTPSLGRTLNPSDLPTIKDLIFGGEMLLAEDVRYWKSVPGIINGYGPAECTMMTTAYKVDTTKSDTNPCIGWGSGAVPWIIDQETGTSLASFGSVGELLLEGPTVGPGYVNNSEKTRAAFVEDPLWLVNGGGPGFPGRRGRLYKTGDLVRYNVDGSLEFMGRKDAQVKIRGQRVELDDIAHHVRSSLAEDCQVVAEVITPSQRQTSVLAAFVSIKSASQQDVNLAVKQLTEGVDEKLAERVPAYMIPSVYIPLGNIPMTTTGKTDRRQLREIGASMTLEELGELTATRTPMRKPSTDMELQLQALWSTVLDVDLNSIGADHSFLKFGGDSIAAMRLVGNAREQGLQLSVADVFKHSRLCDLADVVTRSAGIEEAIKPYELLNSDIQTNKAREQAAKLCGLEFYSIEDIFPCTPLQEGLLALTAKSSGDYINRTVLELQDNIDLNRFRAAWEDVVARTPILRTRIIDLPQQGLVQVVVSEKVQWISEGNVNLNDDKAIPLGIPLVRFGLHGQAGRPHIFSWIIHHALYDGWSVPLILDQVEKTYKQEPTAELVPFQPFVKNVLNVGEERARAYWRAQLDNCEAAIFPALPSKNYQPRSDQSVEHQISSIQWPKVDVTSSIVVRAAWSILAARYTDSSDVVFGMTSSGRQAKVPGVEQMAGPTIATVPVRASIDWNTSVKDLMNQLQTQATEMVEYEQTGLSRIRSIGADIEEASQFQTLMVIQPADEGGTKQSSIFKNNEKSDDTDVHDFNSYALLLGCQLETDGLRLSINYDSYVMDSEQARRIAQQLEHILRQLCLSDNQEKKLSTIDWTSHQDLCEIWSRNATISPPIEKCVHDLIGEIAKTTPQAPAVCAWDGEFTHAELDELSTRLAHHLVTLGVEPETNVPLCIDKSKWAPVAMLGVMKAGGASVALDTSLPDERINTIITQVNASVVVSSSSNEERASQLTGNPIVVVPEKLTQTSDKQQAADLPTVRPSNTLYIVFTSGSTGTPKGVVITHSNFCSAIEHQKEALGLTSNTRLYDFVSYAFDISWANNLKPLAIGGCVCIPSQEERQNAIASSITRYRANWSVLTPSLARSIEPSEVPTLEVLVFGGEAVLAEDIERWKGIPRLINGYGPAECSVMSTACDVDKSQIGNPSIGWGYGLATWILDLESESSLASNGTIGELLLEGPLVGQGYLNNPEKTAAAFIEDPQWLLDGVPGSSSYSGRRGRLYRTGDLVRYNADGSLAFMGRKDAQVKIRGQRIELGEVEHNVRQNLIGADCPVVAGMVTPGGSSNPILAAFLVIDEEASTSTEDLSQTVQKLTLGLDDRLAERLPPAMIPAAYIPIREIPMTLTGKTDHRQLKKIGASMTLQELVAATRAPVKAPSTDMERQLQELWATVIGSDPNDIGAEDTFIQAGGDSIAAMRLVNAARERDISLTVADVFQYKRLSDLAAALEHGVGSYTNPEPFSLVSPGVDLDAYLQKNVRPHLKDHNANIEDVLPVTNIQASWLEAGTSVARRQCFHFFIDLPVGSDVEKLAKSCSMLCNRLDILRTIFIHNQHEYLQVVLQEIKPRIDVVQVNSDIAAVCQELYDEDLKESAPLGSSFIRFLITHSQDGHVRLTLRLPHSQYDGISMGPLLTTFAACHSGQEMPTLPRFSGYINHARVQQEPGRGYWRSLLKDSRLTKLDPTVWPNLGSPSNETVRIQKTVPALASREGITDPVVFSALCACAIGRVTKSEDVVLGLTVSGRSTLPAGLQGVVGPCFNNIPVRAHLDGANAIESALASVKDQIASSMQFETSPFADIVENCTEWPGSTDDFGFVVGLQNFDEEYCVDGIGKLNAYVRTPDIRSPLVDIVAKPRGESWEVQVTASTRYHTLDAIQSLADELAVQMASLE